MTHRDPRLRRSAERTIPRRRDQLVGHDSVSPPLTPPPPGPPDGRSDVTLLSGLNVLAGLWLIIAPWVLAYWSSDPRWNDVASGVAVGVFAVARIVAPARTEWLSWLNAVIGVWVFVAAFTIDHSRIAAWNNAILGAIVFFLAIGSADATRRFLSRRGSGPPQVG